MIGNLTKTASTLVGTATKLGANTGEMTQMLGFVESISDGYGTISAGSWGGVKDIVLGLLTGSSQDTTLGNLAEIGHNFFAPAILTAFTGVPGISAAFALKKLYAVYNEYQQGDWLELGFQALGIGGAFKGLSKGASKAATNVVAEATEAAAKTTTKVAQAATETASKAGSSVASTAKNTVQNYFNAFVDDISQGYDTLNYCDNDAA